jgi:hypothetical protein
MINSNIHNPHSDEMQLSNDLVHRFFTIVRKSAGETPIANVIIENRIYWVDPPRESVDLLPFMRIHWLRDETSKMAGELVHSLTAEHLTKKTCIMVTRMNLMDNSTITRAKMMK